MKPLYIDRVYELCTVRRRSVRSLDCMTGSWMRSWTHRLWIGNHSTREQIIVTYFVYTFRVCLFSVRECDVVRPKWKYHEVPHKCVHSPCSEYVCSYGKLGVCVFTQTINADDALAKWHHRKWIFEYDNWMEKITKSCSRHLVISFALLFADVERLEIFCSHLHQSITALIRSFNIIFVFVWCVCCLKIARNTCYTEFVDLFSKSDSQLASATTDGSINEFMCIRGTRCWIHKNASQEQWSNSKKRFLNWLALGMFRMFNLRFIHWQTYT